MSELVAEEDVMESEYMTTSFVVVPKASCKEFEAGYEKMATYVVPRSGLCLEEDNEYGLYRVILFKKCLDEFKASAREKRLTLREYTFDAKALADESARVAADTVEHGRLRDMLSNWCHINFAEVCDRATHPWRCTATPCTFPGVHCWVEAPRVAQVYKMMMHPNPNPAPTPNPNRCTR